MNNVYGVSVPFMLDNKNGFAMTETLQDMVRQQIKMLFLTNPGERIRDIKFGIGIRKYLFENKNPILSSDIKAKINEQIKKYLSYVNINDIQIIMPDDTEEMYVKFSYNVDFLNLQEEYIFLV
jgi:phage baseplate assembly protein W